IDGGDPAYLQRYLAEGAIPNIARFMKQGFSTVADGTVPSFTCPNNMSIITGTPASKHGISGNYYLDVRTGEAVVMTGPELLRGDTILSRFAKAGAKVVSITAKDKLRKQLAKDLDVSRGNISFSSEFAGKCTRAENGIDKVLDFVGMPQPGMYSMELSLFVLEAGIKLLERDRPDLLYLSLTDYVQHKYAPHEAEAKRFYQELDRRFGRLADLGAVVALTADHGMNDKSDEKGRPNVIWLQDILDKEFGKGDTRVICPITDAFVAHHGALGGFVRVWCQGKATPRDVIAAIHALPGVESVLDKATACRVHDLPADREADVVVISTADVCIGGSAAQHDLSGLGGHRLRTHGGVSEAKVPIILSEPLNDGYRLKAGTSTLKSYQVFDFALNGW
ncbi:MAG: phosphonoacetate hydrolase, partial [Burkholderiales bacterium]|nr:phosphonoacetate hydrolase [Burkholderiales bacterium]